MKKLTAFDSVENEADVLVDLLDDGNTISFTEGNNEVFVAAAEIPNLIDHLKDLWSKSKVGKARGPL